MNHQRIVCNLVRYKRILCSVSAREKPCRLGCTRSVKKVTPKPYSLRASSVGMFWNKEFRWRLRWSHSCSLLLSFSAICVSYTTTQPYINTIHTITATNVSWFTDKPTMLVSSERCTGWLGRHHAIACTSRETDSNRFSYTFMIRTSMWYGFR